LIRHLGFFNKRAEQKKTRVYVHSKLHLKNKCRDGKMSGAEISKDPGTIIFKSFAKK
jgi:hypothetical protein